MLDRRTFLASSLAPLVPAPAQEKLRIGFLGATHSHARAKIDLVAKSPLFELAGVAETDPTVRAALEKAGVPLLAREALLGDAAVRAIAVESDVKDHAADARMALEAGKHVHVEKPPSTGMEEFRALVALARQKNRLMQMGYMWRHHPGFEKIFEAVRAGWLGDIYLVKGTINTLIPPEQRPGWAVFPGGHMFELCAHLIDALVRLMGPTARVTPYLQQHAKLNDTLKDNVAAVFEYPRALGIITGATLQPDAGRHRSFEVFGTAGTAVLRPIEPPALRLSLAKAAGPYPAGNHDVPLPPYQRYGADFEELAAAIAAGKPLSVTPEEDLNVHEALLRASNMWTVNPGRQRRRGKR